MAIPDEKLERARTMLQAAERPLFFHDDDPDGVCSFVQLYQYTGYGVSVCVKNSPCLGEEYLRKVEENGPDLIVVLDKPQISDDFLDAIDLPIIWIDHHAPQTELTKHYANLLYLNPRIEDDSDNSPTSFWTYNISKKSLWIAAVGCVGDWFLPPFIREVRQEHPVLFERIPRVVEELYLDTPIGEIVRVIQFNLKGTVSDVRKSIMTLTRVESPEEILNQTTSRGRYLWRKYRRLAAPYERMLAQALEVAEADPDSRVLQFIYQNDEQSFTTELSNELLVRYPKRVIIAGRHHDGKYKCSLRSKDVEIPNRMSKALEGLEGRGGGHTHACGLVVEGKDWEEFVSRFVKSLANERQ